MSGRNRTEATPCCSFLLPQTATVRPNPDPDCFDAFRRERRTYTYGAGAHACPGEKLAVTMANAGFSGLIDSALDVRALTAMTYRSLANARIPQFATR